MARTGQFIKRRDNPTNRNQATPLQATPMGSGNRQGGDQGKAKGIETDLHGTSTETAPYGDRNGTEQSPAWTDRRTDGNRDRDRPVRDNR